MNRELQPLPPVQAAILRVVLRSDAKGSRPVSTRELQAALRARLPSRMPAPGKTAGKTGRLYTAQIQPLVDKGLIVRTAGGWLSTWAAQKLREIEPSLLGLAAGDLPLPLPGLEPTLGDPEIDVAPPRSAVLTET